MALPLLLFPSSASACQTAAACPNAAQSELHLQDGSGAYATGKYRNLFAETGHSSTAIQAKIDAAYQQLFHGDPQSQAVFFSAGKNASGHLAYVTDWANHDVRTEGMSYGMMIAVQMNKKDDFDALWNWTKTYMYAGNPQHPSYGYFFWSCKTDGTPNEETAAPDGEEYFAMSLLFAANRWGSGKGIYDYKAEAERLLTAMRHREIMSGMTRFGQRVVGPEVNEQHAMILFHLRSRS
jgi:oligosaccharide reducing-end xylanase